MSVTMVVQHLICRYCGAGVERTIRKGDKPRAAVCDAPACRHQCAQEAGRRGGESKWL